MSQGNNLQRLEHSWFSHKYSNETRSIYILQNYNKADCSFLIKDVNMYSQKVVKSFIWILNDVSSYFRKMFAENSNRKEIPIDDPNFEHVLFYVHTKMFPNISDQPFEQFERLLEMHERAKIYEIYDLNLNIMSELRKMISQGTVVRNKFAYFFELAQGNKFKVPELLDSIKSAVRGAYGDEMTKYIIRSMNIIWTFDVDLFISFITHISRTDRLNRTLVAQPVILHIIESYLKKNPSFGETIKKDNMAKSAFNALVYFGITPSRANPQDFKDYPKILQLLK